MTLPSVNPSGRVAWLAAPVASPGQCGMCGTPTHEKGFLYFGLEFEFFGTLILCHTCVAELARAFGFNSPEDIVDLRQQVDDLNVETDTLRKAILGLEAAVDGLTNYRDLHGNFTGGLGKPPGVPAVASSNSVDSDSEGAATDSPSESGTRTVTSGKPTSPSAKSRPDDVRDTSTADAILGLPNS